MKKKLGRPKKIIANEPEYVGINVDDEVKRKFRIGVRLYYNNRVAKPLSKAYKQTIDNLFNVGYREEKGVKIPVLPPAYELPTLAQFQYWLKKEQDLKQTIISRAGERDFQLKHRGVLGSSTLESFGPGSRFQIDATIGDVYLVHRYNRQWIIGKPVIYAIIDVFSRFIAGVYVGLEGPSWLGAMMALENATKNKVSFCAEYGIEISEDQWPSCYLPNILTADRGELVGDKPTHLIKFLNVSVENLPPFRADWKGIVEQHFNVSNQTFIHWLPGAVRKRIRERGERDYRLDAKLDLDQFTKLIIECALYHNNQHRMLWYLRDEFLVCDDVDPYPIELWNWGIKNRGGHLHKHPEDIVRLNLMPSDTATVTHNGILFKKMLYSCEKALNEQWFLHARRKSWRVHVSYDPRMTDYLYIRAENGKGFEVATLLDSQVRYKNKRFEEIQDLLEYENFLNQEALGKDMQADATLNAKINLLVKQASEMTDASQATDLSQRQRLLGIKEHRKIEKEERRFEQGWSLQEENNTFKEGRLLSFGQTKPLESKEEDDYISPADYSDLLIIPKGGEGDNE